MTKGSDPGAATAGWRADRERRSDPRLLAYMIAGLGALLVAIVAGQPVVAATGAPFVVLATMGLVTGIPSGVRARVHVATDRLIEGHVLKGEVVVDWDGTAEVEVLFSGLRGLSPVEPPRRLGWSLPAGVGPHRLSFRVRADTWGRQHLGTLWIRARRPGTLVFREVRQSAGQPVRVLPTPLRLDRLLKPAEPRAVSGVHASRLRGHGTDLADLRPYQPGDRLRDLSWATSARLGSPWVKTHHPERTGVVLLLLDSFITDEQKSTEALARAARAAWAVASVHLRAQDRVGLLASGRTAAWVPPRGGRRARLQILDELLAVGGAATEGRRRWERSGRHLVPADALVIGVTSLRSRLFVQSLLHYRRHGHRTVALVVDTADVLPLSDHRVDRAIRRIWVARRDEERHLLERNGVPTALITAEHGVGSAVSALRRRLSVARRSSSRSARPAARG